MKRTRPCAGWSARVAYIAGHSISVFTAPDGTEYVPASKRERADVICTGRDKTLAPLPLRKLETSNKVLSTKRAAKKQAKRKAAKRKG